MLLLNMFIIYTKHTLRHTRIVSRDVVWMFSCVCIFLHACIVHSLHLSAVVTKLCIIQSFILDITWREIWAINHPRHSYVPHFGSHFWKAKLSLEIRSDWLGKLGVEIIIILSSFPQLCFILMTLALLHIC